MTKRRHSIVSEQNKKTIRIVREDAPTNFSVLDALYTDDYVYHGIPLLGDLKGSDKSKPESPAKPTKSKTDSLGAQASLPASFH